MASPGAGGVILIKNSIVFNPMNGIDGERMDVEPRTAVTRWRVMGSGSTIPISQ